MVGGLASLNVVAPQVFHATTAHAQSASDDVLLIHGIAGGNLKGSDGTVPSGCAGGGNFGGALSYFKNSSHYWSGTLKTVGYYGEDGNSASNGCDVVFSKKCTSSGPNGAYNCFDSTGRINQSVEQHQTNCDSYYYVAGNDGTNDQDLKNIGCQLAWYIWYNYTSQHRSVRVVTHSMGGLIFRWAVDRVSKQDPAFPPYLYIPEVVQIAAPNWGVPGVAYGDPITCPEYDSQGHIVDQCTMLKDMIPVSGAPTSAPADFINVLQAEDYAPEGSYSVPTEWTIMSAFCDQWSSGVDWTSAMNFPPARPEFPAVHKILYAGDVYKPDGTPYSSCGFPPNSVHDYSHGDYLVDQQDVANTSAQLCDNCPQSPPDSVRINQGFDHSLHMVFQHLSADAPVPPATNCYSQPNEQDCNGYSYKEQSCPDYPQAQTASDTNVSIVLHYSGSACQSNWSTAQISSAGASQGFHITKVDVERQATSRLGATQIVDNPSAAANIQTWYSRMVWAPDSPALGCVWYTNGSNSYTLCTPPSPIVTGCVSQPSAANCDGKDYIQQGCNHYPQSQQYNDSNVSLILEYSTNCQSNFSWAQIKNSGDVIRQIDIERQSTPQTPAKTLTDYPDTTTWYTNMVWAPVAAARGCIWYGPANSHNTIYGPFCTPWTPVTTGCASSPSDAHCNNQDYIQQGCNHYPQSGAGNTAYITVTLEWSTNCQSNFTYAAMKTNIYVLYKVDIERASSSYDPALTLTDYPGGATWYTNMIYSPNNSARGCAWYVQPDYARIYGPVCSTWV